MPQADLNAIRPGTADYEFIVENRKDLHHPFPKQKKRTNIGKSPLAELLSELDESSTCGLCNPQYGELAADAIFGFLDFWVSSVNVIFIVVGVVPLLALLHPATWEHAWAIILTSAVLLTTAWLLRVRKPKEPEEDKDDPFVELVEKIKKEIRRERSKASATELERRPENRAAYVKNHRKELEQNEKAIREKHELIFGNSARVELFRKYGGEEVIEMWREPYVRVMMVHGVHEKPQEPPKSALELKIERLRKEYTETYVEKGEERKIRAELKKRAMDEGMTTEEAEELVNEVVGGSRIGGPRL